MSIVRKGYLIWKCLKCSHHNKIKFEGKGIYSCERCGKSLTMMREH